MANGTIKQIINPPDITNAERTALTSGTITPFTSTGAYYCVFGCTEGTSGQAAAYLYNADESAFYAAVDGPTGTYVRVSTSWIYIPKGVQFKARAYFTAAARSGLFKANPL